MADEHQDSIEAMLAAGLGPEQILAMAMAAKRKDRDTAEASARPAIAVGIGAADLLALRTYALRAKDDADSIETDRACAIVRDALAGNDNAALLFALLRLWRSIWWQIPHLGEM